MTTVPAVVVATWLHNDGVPDSAIPVMVAIAMEESGLRSDAVNVNADQWHSRDRGLFQINDHWHPDVSDATAFDPQANTAAAATISAHGANLSPWSSYASGAYKRYLQAGQAALTDFHRNGPAALSTAGLPPQTAGGLGDRVTQGALDIAGASSAAAGAAADAALGATRLAAKLLSVVLNPEFWRRFGLAAAGLAAVVLGFVIVNRDNLERIGATAALA